MTDWAKMRKTWTDARDKNGVKKGAVSGVSIGDAIDKLAKAESKGYGSVLAAAEALSTALDKYRSKLAKSHPAFVTWIEKNIAKEVKATTDAAKLDLASLKWALENVFNDTVVSVENMWPDSAKGKGAFDLTVDTKDPKTWAEAIKAVDVFGPAEKLAALVAKRATTLKALKWNLQLSGRDSAYAAMDAYADAIVEDVKFILKWTKCGDWQGYLNFMQDSRGRKRANDRHDEAKDALKTLMA